MTTVTLDIESLGSLLVPLNLDAVVGAIELMRNSDPLRSFQEALLALDGVVADLFGMSQTGSRIHHLGNDD